MIIDNKFTCLNPTSQNTLKKQNYNWQTNINKPHQINNEIFFQGKINKASIGNKIINKFKKVISKIQTKMHEISEAVDQKLMIFTGKIIDNFYTYTTKLSKKTQAKREQSIKKEVEVFTERVVNIIEKNSSNSSPEKVIEIYSNKLGQAFILPKGDGNEKGLNKVVGFGKLKANLYNDLLIPLCETLNGKNKHVFIPNGITFFGPKGTGKTYFAEQLGEHYIEKGGIFKKFEYASDTKKDIQTLNNIFIEAEKNFADSGKTKYTMVLFDEIEKYLNKSSLNVQPMIARLLELTNNCKDKGVIFLSTSNYLDRIEPALLRTGRTDLRVPIGHIPEYDLADMINYYLKTDKMPHDENNIDFQEIIDAVKTEKLQYKPKDIERKLAIVADDLEDYGGSFSTKTLKEALILSKPEFDEEEARQFMSDKQYAKELGEIYDYMKENY